MKVAIFSGGEYSQVKILPYDKLICADKGYKYAKNLSLIPDFIVGDFDSLDFIPNGAEIYPCDKDLSDTHLATVKAINLGATEIDYYFCLGGRLDHELFNINLLKVCSDAKVKAKIIDKNQTVYFISDKDESNLISAKKGCFISFIPITQAVDFESSLGLKYPLDNLSIKLGQTKTLSNIAKCDTFSVVLNSGEALAIVNE